MFSKSYELLRSKVKISNIFYAIMVLTFFQILLALVFVPGLAVYSQENILDLRFFYTGVEIERYFTALGEPGRNLYFYNEIIDLIYPFAYTTAFMLLTIYLGQKTFKSQFPVKVALLLPLALFITDYAENCSILTMLSIFPEKIFLYQIAGYITMIKQILLAFNIAALTILALIVIKRQFFQS